MLFFSEDMLQISEFGNYDRNQMLTTHHQRGILESVCKSTQLGVRELGSNPRSLMILPNLLSNSGLLKSLNVFISKCICKPEANSWPICISFYFRYV